MNYALTLFLCSYLNTTPVILEQKVLPIKYQTYSECINDGYLSAYSSILNLGAKVVNENKLLVIFECKGFKTI